MYCQCLSVVLALSSHDSTLSLSSFVFNNGHHILTGRIELEASVKIVCSVDPEIDRVLRSSRV